MGNIFTDVVDDINLKPSKSKLVLKWTVRIAIGLIVAAFGYGQYMIVKSNKMSNFEKNLEDNTKATIELREEMKDGFEKVNKRIDKVYEDGYKSFGEYQIFNKEQLKMVIDYGQTNKEMLKRMLDINMLENNKIVENKLEAAKKTITDEKKELKKDSLSIKINKLK